MNEETKTLIPGTFHLVDQTPVNIWKALLNIFDGMTKSAKVMSIVIFMGGALKVIISTGAVEEFLNWAIYKLQKKGIVIIVPLMVILFSVLSAYGGNDSFFAFTVIGVAVAAKMGLDPIAGMAMTFFATSVWRCIKRQNTGSPRTCRCSAVFRSWMENSMAVCDDCHGCGLCIMVLPTCEKEPV